MENRSRATATDELERLREGIRVMSHEMNNSLAPISSLIASARLLLAGPGASLERLDRILATVQDRAANLRAFIEGSARLTGIPAPRPRPVRWPEFLDRLAALFPELAIEAAADLPPVAFDHCQIQQVLINLLANAREAGGPAADVRVRVGRASDGGARLVVLDRGPGISDAVLGELARGRFTTKAHGGGIGLALCRTIVDRHGGRLALERRPGGGMAASLWLPAARASVGEVVAIQPRGAIVRDVAC